MTRTWIAFCGLLACISAISFAQEDAKQLTADQVIQKVRDKYGKLRSYHFEHSLLAEESAEDAKGTKIAEVKLISISENPGKAGIDDSWREMQSKGQVPFELNRMRLEATGQWGTFLLASEGEKRWAYNSKTQEYIEREGRMALGPTAATMFASLHVAPLSKYVDGSLQDAKLLDDEELKISKEVKPCYVVSGRIQLKEVELPAEIKSRKSFPKTNPLQRVTGVLFLLQIHGFAGKESLAYLPSEDAQPQLQLWVDKQDFTIWQSRFTEAVRKHAFDGKDEAKKVQLTVTDRFTVAKIDTDLPADLLRFKPPKEAKLVEQFTKQKAPDE